MKLFLISQTQNDGYDTYDSAVVVAENEAAAKLIHPRGDGRSIENDESYPTWATSSDKVNATYIGEAAEGIHGVVCASFNAG